MNKPVHYHLIGICGTAMGSLAMILKQAGFTVTGSDQNIYPPMSTLLSKAGIPLFQGFSAANLNPAPDVVVVGNAISRGNAELEETLLRRLTYRSLPEVLKEEFLRRTENIVISGTHGKTTTTSLVTWILKANGRDPSWLIGGKANNFELSGHLGRGRNFVLEGDEYDSAYFDKRSKFFHYLPRHLILNNLEFDHADIFRDLDEIILAFRRLINQVPADGKIFFNADDARLRRIAPEAFCARESYGFSSAASRRLSHFKQSPDGISFRLKGYRREFHVPLLGRHNAMNAAAAILLAEHLEIPEEGIRSALAGFLGVERRMRILLENADYLVIDDFAHHPTAIEATLRALRDRYRKKRIIAVFEPRSNTSVRKFHEAQMPQAFSPADAVVIFPLHRAAQIPANERFDLRGLIAILKKKGKEAFTAGRADQVEARLFRLVRPGDAVVFMSNGSFGGISARLCEKLSRAE